VSGNMHADYHAGPDGRTEETSGRNDCIPVSRWSDLPTSITSLTHLPTYQSRQSAVPRSCALTAVSLIAPREY
jgi:hypothetical protein